jgi:hypothetical protein
VSKLKLAFFALDTFSRMAIDKAGADAVGGEMRRARAAARVTCSTMRSTGLGRTPR